MNQTKFWRTTFIFFSLATIGLFSFLFLTGRLTNWFYYQIGGDLAENEPSLFRLLQKAADSILPSVPSDPSENTNQPASGSILLDVPFACQAPLGEWENPVYQDGCEEVSVLMAVFWARGEKNISKQKAAEEITKMAAWQEEKYGSSQDTSAADTDSRLLRGYFNYDQTQVKTGITLEDIVAEIRQGKVVIVPCDGQALGNPYFTAPGPERHMIVIRGYDSEKRQFITNEGGTKRGEKYRYNENILFNSIRDYPSGSHQPIVGVEKTMIVVSK